MNIIIALLSLCASLLVGPNPQLTINVQNIKSTKGEIVIGVFNAEKGFLKEGAAFKNYTLPIKDGTETIVINDLPEGEYAVSLFHDENSDKTCNLNFLGIPKEAYGFSNNIKPKFSAPSYSDCKFLLKKNQVLDIVLRH